MLKLLLEDNNIINKPEIECKDFHGNINGAVYQACWSGNVEIVKYLLEDLKINIKKNDLMYFYCRTKEVFKYINIYLDINNQNEDFIKNVKRRLIDTSPFYDYDMFREILALKIFQINKEDMNILLYNIIIKNNGNHKIIQHLIKLGASLYNEDYDIFLTLMERLTQLEKSNKNNDKGYKNYIKDKIEYINNVQLFG